MWADYLGDFHRQRPGITEQVLSRALDQDGLSPYGWLAAAVPPQARRVLDAACGSAPLARQFSDRTWIGADSSAAELSGARVRGAGHLLRADAASLPLGSRSVDAVCCSMSLQVLEPLDEVLGEAARVLVPGGTFAALVPATGPLRVVDRVRYGRLLLALRRSALAYPNDRPLADATALFRQHGLRIVADQRRPFGYPVRTRSDADAFVRSLYLPDLGDERVEVAIRRVGRWTGRALSIPLRRLVAVAG